MKKNGCFYSASGSLECYDHFTTQQTPQQVQQQIQTQMIQEIQDMYKIINQIQEKLQLQEQTEQEQQQINIGTSSTSFSIGNSTTAANLVLADIPNAKWLLTTSGNVLTFIPDNGIGGWNSGVAQLDRDGNLSIKGQFMQISDSNFKNIHGKIENSLDNISSLSGYYYSLIEDKTDTIQIGVIAQEIEKNYPELVVNTKDGHKEVNYIGLIPVLIESIKELKKEVDLLKSKLQ